MSDDPFTGVPAFAAVAEHGSFTKAAAALSVTPAAVSQAVARLEDDLGVKLLHRTTRSVELTGEGRLYLDHCRAALHQMETGRDRIEQVRQTTEGEVVVALPFILGPLVIDLLPEFIHRYPRLKVRLTFSDRISRLVEEHIDVAIRIGYLKDSTAIARKLVDTQWLMLAAPSYLAQRGTPTTPRDLVDHECIVYRSAKGFEVDWELLKRPGRKEKETVERQARLVMDQGQLIPHAAAAGAGVCMVFSFMAGPFLEKGALVPLLSEYVPPGPPIHALVKPGSREIAKVRVLLDYLADKFRKFDAEALR